ncbi:glycerol kinase [Magnaporthiopsis poae ATCC 64411]|uniref:Glycerol kinase n=1 Tax=Magnaporthiopsis poae (strain ATCC 64411 / 73-15) TaxID=644358 RepID=A0A0C4DZA1_MAGP6|nr:glycerol kinase [Magnaporthiopsis poae ATCC 64411]
MTSSVALPVAAPPASADREAKRARIVEPEVTETVVLKDAAAGAVSGIDVAHVENPAVAQHIENVAQPVARETEDEVFLGSIDQGTTSSRFIIFNRHGEPVEGHQIEFENLYPDSGWHEHDPLELLSSVEECIEQAMCKFSASRPGASVRAVGITNQRETTVVWDSVGRKNRTLFEPSRAKGDRARFDRMFAKWEQAVEMSRGWVREEQRAGDEEEDSAV